MSSWPESLPLFEQSGFSYNPEDGAIRTEMDQGPVKVRPRYTATSTHVSGSMHMTQTQYATLKTFYESTTAYGSIAFDFTDPILNEVKSTRFTGPPTIAGGEGIYVTVGVSMEFLP